MKSLLRLSWDHSILALGEDGLLEDLKHLKTVSIRYKNI